MKYAALFCAFALSACADETLSGYSGAGDWTLREIGTVPFPARATLTLGPNGALSGQAPCNRFRATQTAPYPWFALSPVISTRKACPDLPSETLFFDTLATMSQSEVNGDTLILRNETGAEMVFTRHPSP